MGCKQQQACENNKANNFRGKFIWQHQCRPTASQSGSHSVCRQCCDAGANCAINFIRWNKKAGGPLAIGPWKKVMTSYTESKTFSSDIMPTAEEFSEVQHSGGFQVSPEDEDDAINRLIHSLTQANRPGNLEYSGLNKYVNRS